MRKNFLLFVTSIILIISFGFSTVVSLQSMDILVKENNRDNSVIYANEISNAVIDVFSEAVAVSKSMTNTFVKEFLKNSRNLTVKEQSEILRKYLSDIVYKFGYSTAFLADAKTMAYYSEHGYSKTVDPLNPDDNWYLPFKESGKAYELNVDNDQANNNRLTIYVNMRITDNTGDFLGVCGVGVPMKQVMNLLQTLEAQSDISIKLVAVDGVVKVARSGQLVFQRTEDELKAMLQKYDYSQPYYYEPKKEDAYTVIKYIPECDWFAVIDYAGGKSSASSTMLFKNLMTCLIVMLAVLIIINFILNTFTKHTERFAEEALEDQLTGLKNRRSYALELEKLNRRQNLNDISVASMDINGLKLTNDTFGHNAGDDLLKGSAAAMKAYFGKNGWKLFRTGGDEFIAITTKDVPDRNTIVAEFKMQLKLFHHELIKELSISVGVAKACENNISSVEGLTKIADKRMYADKEIFYSDSSHERRKR